MEEFKGRGVEVFSCYHMVTVLGNSMVYVISVSLNLSILIFNLPQAKEPET